jgi:hypothetical protein
MFPRQFASLVSRSGDGAHFAIAGFASIIGRSFMFILIALRSKGSRCCKQRGRDAWALLNTDFCRCHRRLAQKIYFSKIYFRVRNFIRMPLAGKACAESLSRSIYSKQCLYDLLLSEKH